MCFSNSVPGFDSTNQIDSFHWIFICLYSGNLICDTNKQEDSSAASSIHLLWLHVKSLSQQAASEVSRRYQTVTGLELLNLRDVKQTKQTPDKVWWASVFPNIICQEQGGNRIWIHAICLAERFFTGHPVETPNVHWDVTEKSQVEGFYFHVDVSEWSDRNLVGEMKIKLINTTFVHLTELPGQGHCAFKSATRYDRK